MSRLTGSDALGLFEAYQAVYNPQQYTEDQLWEEVEYWVDNLMREGYDLSDYTWEEMYESYDYYNTIVCYLLDEGYADTNENALVIMANMSEEWRDSIVEAVQIPRPQPTKYIAPSRPLPAPAATIPKPDMSTPADKKIGQRISQTPIGMRLTGPTGPLR